MDYQVGDFVEVLYRTSNRACRGQVLSILPYQITILVYYADSQFLKDHIGLEMRINLDTRGNSYISIKKWETTLLEHDFLCLMHVALQTNDKGWFESLGTRKSQSASVL